MAANHHRGSHLTFQSNINEHTYDSITDYALFMGGLNVTRQVLEQYDPLRTGFGRIFMIRQPLFVANNFQGQSHNKMKKFKHILEYANTGVSGNGNISVQFAQMQGGYANKQLEIPNTISDDANELTIKTYEFSGSPVREIIQYWVNGVIDIQTGYTHYYGWKNRANDNIKASQAFHTAEFIYVVTDSTGHDVEYAALFANCFPKEIKFDHFNYESGQHDLVPMDITFSCTRYMSPQINAKAKQLIYKYNVLMNSLGFNSGYKDSEVKSGLGRRYNMENGQFKYKTAGNKFVMKGLRVNKSDIKDSTKYKVDTKHVDEIENIDLYQGS